MEDFLGKVKEQATKAKTGATKLGKQVYEKTNTAIAITKLSIAVSETDSKIKDAYETIGRTVYDKYITDGTVCDIVGENCRAIDELFKEREALLEKKAELKSSIKCPDCGKYNNNDSAYCSKCGTKLTSEEKQDKEAENSVEEDNADVPDAAPAEEQEAAEVGEETIVSEDVEDDNILTKVKKVITIKAKKPVED